MGGGLRPGWFGRLRGDECRDFRIGRGRFGLEADAALLASGVDPIVTGLVIGLSASAYTPARTDLEEATVLVRLATSGLGADWALGGKFGCSDLNFMSKLEFAAEKPAGNFTRRSTATLVPTCSLR